MFAYDDFAVVLDLLVRLGFCLVVRVFVAVAVCCFCFGWFLFAYLLVLDIGLVLCGLLFACRL